MCGISKTMRGLETAEWSVTIAPSLKNKRKSKRIIKFFFFLMKGKTQDKKKLLKIIYSAYLLIFNLKLRDLGFILRNNESVVMV